MKVTSDWKLEKFKLSEASPSPIVLYIVKPLARVSGEIKGNDDSNRKKVKFLKTQAEPYHV
jgi:hypothetical protein